MYFMTSEFCDIFNYFLFMFYAYIPHSPEIFFLMLSLYSVYFINPQCFLFGRCVVFGRIIEVFLDISVFPLMACHCLSAHGNKSFFYLPFLSFSTFASYPSPLFSSMFFLKRSHFLPFFDLFSTDIRAVSDFFEELYFVLFFLSAFVFKICPEPLYFYIRNKSLTKVKTFFFERFQCPIICDP